MIFTGSVDLIINWNYSANIRHTIYCCDMYQLLWNIVSFIVYHRMKMLLSLTSCLNFPFQKIFLLNQKMMNSYAFTYHGAEARAIHRSMADMVSLSDALASVGFRRIGLPSNTDANPKMEIDRADKDRPRIQVVDHVYKNPTLPHSNLQDASPIVISGV